MIRKLLWTGICICLMALGMGIGALAVEYPEVDLSDRMQECRIKQRAKTDCAITSVASVEAYMNYIKGNSSSVYKRVKRANGGSNEVSFSALGYKTLKPGRDFGGDKQSYLYAIYARLCEGEPVIVKRNSNPEHYSVVVGYTGSADELKLENFRVMDVLRTSGSVSLSSWIRTGRLRKGTTITQIVVRKRGVIRNEVPVTTLSQRSSDAHTHKFVRVSYETAHPHREYELCGCGEKRYTASYGVIAGCASCVHTDDHSGALACDMLLRQVAVELSIPSTATLPAPASIQMNIIQEYQRGEQKLRIVEENDNEQKGL